MTDRAIVVGGGVAGLCAAFELRDRGLEVELVEGHGWLGGRAFSPRARLAGGVVDNGPHVVLGAYRHFRRLLRRLGTEDTGFVRPRELELHYRDGRGQGAHLRLGRGPAWLALGPALLRFTALAPAERLRALRGVVRASLGTAPRRSLADWIARHAQEGGPRRYLWDPLCRAIMNAEAEEIEARPFLRTLRRAFAGSGAGAAIWLPRLPWSEIVGEPASSALARAGVVWTPGRRVVAAERRAARIAALRFGDGSERRVAANETVVSAVPWHACERLFPGAGGGPPLSGAAIVSIYFSVPDDCGLPPEPLIALVDGRPFHFLCRRVGARPGEFALLGAGGTSLTGATVEAIADAAREQLRRHFPASRIPADASFRVVREARATLLLAPGVDARRPPPGRARGFDNLVLCGDWTAVGLPSTLEGAAESGDRAAASV